jgi:hypothetical protein
MNLFYRFFPLYGDPDGEHFECWMLLGAMTGNFTPVSGFIGSLFERPDREGVTPQLANPGGV